MAREQANTQEYVTILSSDGTFRLSVPEGTEGAVTRDWEVGEKSGTKHELVFQALSGKITNVEFSEQDFGTLLQVEITDEAGPLVISTSASNNFGIDLMKKLPSLDLEKEYRLSPYTIEKENGKTAKGVSIIEGTKYDKEASKVPNFFWDAKKESTTEGFPEPKGDTEKYTKNKWKAYFGEVEDFLIDYTKENTIPKFNTDDVKPIEDEDF